MEERLENSEEDMSIDEEDKWEEHRIIKRKRKEARFKESQSKCDNSHRTKSKRAHDNETCRE